MHAKRSLTIGDVSRKLAERVPLSVKGAYQLFYGVNLLAAGDKLSSHIDGDTAELIACEDEDDSSDDSGTKRKDGGKTKGNKKKKDKGKDKKSKGKSKKEKKKESKKKKALFADSQKDKKAKRNKVEILSKNEQIAKNAWISDRLDQLRKETSPQLPMALCLVRAQKEWEEKREAEAKEEADNSRKNWPPMVFEAIKEAEDEAKAAGKSESEVKLAGEMAAGFALKVAKENGLYKEPENEEDPSKVPLFFQKRAGLEKAISFLEKKAA
eukprot:CAMPEP_0169287304 /NCGR_PEP_ID=MMETSP1016-20121227/59814_1 /TAXON_ID=342587 /ORGANISM="Karlodinium micrum, Strain CCMP2283" /LENGTH=267 /DNA_ID=CAMNT_0009377177 /DNA_START=57 /DNA_END=859 /DNA_ORIENTATION=+